MKKNIEQKKIRNSEISVSRSTSNGMKNKKVLNLIKISFFLFIFFSFLINITSAVSFGYINENNETLACGFESQASCDAYLKTQYPDKDITCDIDVNCTDPNLDNPVIIITPVENSDTTTDTYNLLAPIGTFTQAPENIGDYFNTIFLIAIGLCGALAVVMIVIGGIQYMGEESIFGKTKAKEQITSAILGLLIALGAFALLNTINPALLGGGVHIAQVSAEILEPPMMNESVDIPPDGTAINQCSQGIQKIETSGGTMHLCKSIANNVKAGVNFAWTQNIKLSGAAFRSKADQIKFRVQNQCPDVYTSPASDCKPPTAIPGTSMHESGLAIDFRCNGQSIQSKDNECFLWLKNNASTFGLQNFEKEPWHWSTNGH
jgi:hypothetical protein